MKEVIKLECNEKLYLKQLEKSDAKDVFTAITTQKAYLGKWLPFVEQTLVAGDTEAFVNSIVDQNEPMTDIIFAIIRDDAFAGLVGFKSIDYQNKKAELGYWLSERFQHEGVMTTTVKTLLDFGFQTLEFNRIEIKVAVDNFKSIGIPKRLGFVEEGVERAGELLADGKFVNLKVFSMLFSEYKTKVSFNRRSSKLKSDIV